jgi:hypothetical protein
VLKALADMLAAESVSDKMWSKALDARCETAGKSWVHADPIWVAARTTTPLERLMHATAEAIRGLRWGRPADGWAAARESVRLAASERGVEEAVACVTEAARLCGMAV